MEKEEGPRALSLTTLDIALVIVRNKQKDQYETRARQNNFFSAVSPSAEYRLGT
jgi:hypothetical protein